MGRPLHVLAFHTSRRFPRLGPPDHAAELTEAHLAQVVDQSKRPKR